MAELNWAPLAPAPTTLERLRVFHAISVAGSVAGAARNLAYTPSAVSQHLAALEREVAAALVERSNRGVTLTAAGVALAERAATLLDGVRTAVDHAAASGNQAAKIVVAAFPTAVSALLLPLRSQLADALELKVIDAEAEAAVAALLARAVDVAITDGHAAALAGARAGLHRVVLATEPVLVVTRADRHVAELAELATAPWVLGAGDGRLASAARAACAAAGFEPDVVVESDDHYITFDTIRAYGAVSVLPELALAHVPEDIAVSSIRLPFERRIELVTRAALASNPAVLRLAQALRPRDHVPGD